jgi:hypothetical protein
MPYFIVRHGLPDNGHVGGKLRKIEVAMGID